MNGNMKCELKCTEIGLQLEPRLGSEWTEKARVGTIKFQGHPVLPKPTSECFVQFRPTWNGIENYDLAPV